jgi:hypothetical protein
MKDPQSRTIDGVTYTMTPLPPRQGLIVGTIITKVLGQAGKTPDAPIAGILSALDAKDLQFLCDTYAKITTVDLGNGKSPVLFSIFDSHFEANYGAMTLWLAFCLEVDFGSLFLVMKNELPALLGRFGVSLPPASEP